MERGAIKRPSTLSDETILSCDFVRWNGSWVCRHTEQNPNQFGSVLTFKTTIIFFVASNMYILIKKLLSQLTVKTLYGLTWLVFMINCFWWYSSNGHKDNSIYKNSLMKWAVIKERKRPFQYIFKGYLKSISIHS
jgi:hypothetical protein